MIVKLLAIIYLCANIRHTKAATDSDLKTVIKDILQRLEDKEARIQQLEGIVLQQQGRIGEVELEVAKQKERISVLEADAATGDCSRFYASKMINKGIKLSARTPVGRSDL